MQFRYFKHSRGDIDRGHFRAFRSHGFRQYPPATTYIQDLGQLQVAALADVFQPRGIQIVQGSEWTLRIPPTRRHGVELQLLLYIQIMWIFAIHDMKSCCPVLTRKVH
jgi:hypothetical protein